MGDGSLGQRERRLRGLPAALTLLLALGCSASKTSGAPEGLRAQLESSRYARGDRCAVIGLGVPGSRHEISLLAGERVIGVLPGRVGPEGLLAARAPVPEDCDPCSIQITGQVPRPPAADALPFSLDLFAGTWSPGETLKLRLRSPGADAQALIWLAGPQGVVATQGPQALSRDVEQVVRLAIPKQDGAYRVGVIARAGERSALQTRKLWVGETFELEPRLPAVARVGDRLRAGAWVLAHGAEPGPALVALDVEGIGMRRLGPAQRQIDLPAEGRFEALFDLRGMAAGNAYVTLMAKRGGRNVKKRRIIEVLELVPLAGAPQRIERRLSPPPPWETGQKVDVTLEFELAEAGPAQLIEPGMALLIPEALAGAAPFDSVLEVGNGFTWTARSLRAGTHRLRWSASVCCAGVATASPATLRRGEQLLAESVESKWLATPGAAAAAAIPRARPSLPAPQPVLRPVEPQ